MKAVKAVKACAIGLYDYPQLSGNPGPVSHGSLGREASSGLNVMQTAQMSPHTGTDMERKEIQWSG